MSAAFHSLAVERFMCAMFAVDWRAGHGGLQLSFLMAVASMSPVFPRALSPSRVRLRRPLSCQSDMMGLLPDHALQRTAFALTVALGAVAFALPLVTLHAFLVRTSSDGNLKKT